MGTWQLAGIIAAGMLSVAVAIRSVLKRRRRRKALREQFRERARTARPTPNWLRADTQALIDQLDEVARRSNQRLEDRAARLEVLLATADAKMEELRQLLRKLSPPTQPAEPATDAQPPEEPEAKQAGAAPAADSERATPPPDELERALSAPGAAHADEPQAATAQTSQPAARRPGGAKQMDILRLAGEGLAAVEIARRLAMDTGEVELTLNLYGSGGRDANRPPTGE